MMQFFFRHNNNNNNNNSNNNNNKKNVEACLSLCYSLQQVDIVGYMM